MGSGARPTAAGVSDIAIGPATVDDLDAVASIERAVFSDPWSRQSFADALAHPSVYFICGRRRECPAVVGYVGAWFVADGSRIANLAVAPEGWGHGIGKQL